MRQTVDKEVDARYLHLDNSLIVEAEEVSPRAALDCNESDEVTGVDMRSLSERSPNLNLSVLQFETVRQMPVWESIILRLTCRPPKDLE